jgi:hypothetical protein
LGPRAMGTVALGSTIRSMEKGKSRNGKSGIPA